tara:strand:+ start:1223 stop:1861 length:639 start_codon:yes stop_codon:yes gene_type:complete
MDNLADLEVDIYYKLLKGLLNIDKNQPSGVNVLCDMDYLTQRILDPTDDFCDVVEEHSISPMCFDGIGENFMCLCGKPHLKILNICSYKSHQDTYLLGSECIERLKELDCMKVADPQLKSKLDSWINIIKEKSLERGKKKCLTCGLKKVRKGYEYQDKRRKLFCKNCIKGDYFKCPICKNWEKMKKEHALNFKGEVKDKCKTCWKRERGYID